VRAVTRVRAAALALLLAGCCFGPGPGGAPLGPPPDDTANDGMRALEGHFAPGQPYGEGPEAQEIARALHEGGEPGDAVVVQVIDGSPRRIVALLQYVDVEAEGLPSLSEAERRDHLDAILADLDDLYSASDAQIGIGVRGTFFYGGILTRAPGGAPRVEVGTILSSDPLEAILDAPITPPPPLPEIVPGAPFRGGARFEPATRLALTLDAPVDLAPHVTVAGEEDQELVTIVVCRGEVRLHQCLDTGAEVEPTELDDEPWEVLRLGPGRYTVIVAALDECLDPGCEPIPFELELRTIAP
jgi:hypothetical protein